MGHDNSFFATIMGHNISWFFFGWPSKSVDTGVDGSSDPTFIGRSLFFLLKMVEMQQKYPTFFFTIQP